MPCRIRATREPAVRPESDASAVTDGKITRSAEIRVVRGKEIVHKGKLSSLKHVKENVNEIKSSGERRGRAESRENQVQ